MGKLQRKYKKLSVFNESNIQHRNTTDRGAIFVQEERGSTGRDNSQNFKMEAYSEDFNVANPVSQTDVRNKTINLNHLNQQSSEFTSMQENLLSQRFHIPADQDNFNQQFPSIHPSGRGNSQGRMRFSLVNTTQ